MTKISQLKRGRARGQTTSLPTTRRSVPWDRIGQAWVQPRKAFCRSGIQPEFERSAKSLPVVEGISGRWSWLCEVPLICWGNWGTWGMGGREWAKHTWIPAEEFGLDLEALQILCLIFGVSYVLIWRVGKSERETLKYRSSVLKIYLLFFFKWLALLTSIYFSKKLYITAISGKLKMPDVFWNSDFFSDSERWYNAYT